MVIVMIRMMSMLRPMIVNLKANGPSLSIAGGTDYQSP